MNKRFFKIISAAGVVGVCTAFVCAPVSLAASEDEKLQIEMAEQLYIGEVSNYCHKTLFGQQGMPEWNERNGTAYKSCLREYGVLFKYKAEDLSPHDLEELQTYGLDDKGRPLVDMDKEIARAKAALAQTEKSGKGHSDFSLTDKGRAAVASRLEKQGLKETYGRYRSSSDSGHSSQEEKKSSRKPAYIYEKPKSEDENSSTSRVFKGYQ